MTRMARREQFRSLRRAAAEIAWCWHRGALTVALAMSIAGHASSAFGQAEPVAGEAVLQANPGFARLTIKLAEDVESQVTAAGQIIVIRFKRPVSIAVGKIGDAVPAYVSSARIDPDGAAIRLSLARRVTINTMTAGERLFVDLLPDSWTGAPPSLPSEVVRELSERARAAERALRQQKADDIARKRPPVRVKASVQPTFVRFMFEMPDGVGVSSVLNEQKLTLLFNVPLTFDLADAKVAAPPNVASIGQRIEGDKSVVEAELIGDVDVHSFREEKSYVIDVAFQQADKAPATQPKAETRAPAAPSAPAAAPLAAMKPAEAPAKQEAPAQPEPQAGVTPAELPPPTSEMIAEQAKIEIKSEAAVKPAPSAETSPQVQETPQAAEKPSPAVEPAMPAAAAVLEKPATVEAAKPPAPKAEAVPPEAETPKAKPVASAPAAMPVVSGDKTASVAAQRDADGLRVTFSFAATTPAALFRRADTVWLVFDAANPVNIDAIRSKGGALVAEVNSLSIPQGQAVRIRLNRPQLPSLTGEQGGGGSTWTLTFADTIGAAAGRGAQHHRTVARQRLGAARQSRPAAQIQRSRRRRHAGRHHRAAADPRPDQAPGLCRADAAGIDSRHCRAPEFGRRYCRDRHRQDQARQAGRVDAVVGRRRGGARCDRSALALRRRGMAQEPGGSLHCAPGRADDGRGEGDDLG
jgi:hypothetical protein